MGNTDSLQGCLCVFSRRVPPDETLTSTVPEHQKAPVQTPVSLCIEREHPGLYLRRPSKSGESPAFSDASTCTQSTSGSDSGSQAFIQRVPFKRTTGLGLVSVPPGRLDQEKLHNFRHFLQDTGIDTSKWGVDGGVKDDVEHAPNRTLWQCMAGMKTDWPRVWSIADRIQEPAYTLEEYYMDLLAFPELSLYIMGDAPADVKEGTSLTSGRTHCDELQRTIGAFFAIYWLLRLETDGKDGFSNGVDQDWMPIHDLEPDDPRVEQAQKRVVFKNSVHWDFFHQLFVDAGVVENICIKGMCKTTKKSVKINQQRLVALLALTAIHDIMKINTLLPIVQGDHAPYHGYSAGDTISDHDHALSYVMEHYPELLPSFRDLNPAGQKSIIFTQCDLCFNNGWLVQAEASPGAIFTRFREILIRDNKSNSDKKDVAFFFVHWLTDLAGALPTPLAGCDKFVTKFPLPVLNSFLRSFEFVERITTRTETEVMEEYLKMRWNESIPSLGPLPVSPDAIARMRLLCMAQSNFVHVLNAFQTLNSIDKDILCVEMARTGCVDQRFSVEYIPEERFETLVGPAFIIYYGPAFLQKVISGDCHIQRLALLAEIFRCARRLWPMTVSEAATNVLIRIDLIKDMGLLEILQATSRGDVWLLVKHNDCEAFVECASQTSMNEMRNQYLKFEVLNAAAVAVYRNQGQ